MKTFIQILAIISANLLAWTPFLICSYFDTEAWQDSVVGWYAWAVTIIASTAFGGWIGKKFEQLTKEEK